MAHSISHFLERMKFCYTCEKKKRHFRNFDYKVCHMTGNNFSNFLMKLWTTADPAVSTRASKCYYRALWSVFQKKLFKNWPHYTYFGIFCMVEISTKQSISQEGRGWWKLFFWDRCIALFYTRTQSILQKNSLPDIFRTIKVARLFLPSTVLNYILVYLDSSIDSWIFFSISFSI